MSTIMSGWKVFHVLAIIHFLIIFPALTTGVFLGNMEMLKALRQSLVSSRTAIPSWFDPRTSPCNWTGIRCEGTVVTEIDLSCKTTPLNIPFPDLVGTFRSLKYLNLRHCALTGGISPSLWSWENLERLDLSDNELTGILPESISNLKKLRVLMLDKNRFSGNLPPAVGELEELTELSVKGNMFSGNLPEELGNLRKLMSLDLSVNKFSGGLPSTFGNLTRLLSLEARQNDLVGPIIMEIGNLRMLRILDLSENPISGSLPITIANLKDLRGLILQNCSITGYIPEEISELNSLTHLNLAENNFEGGLPTGIGKLENLVYLSAPSAGLSGSIPSQLGNCKKLKTIDLSFNLFSGPLPVGLAGMESINSVLLGSNYLSGPVPEWISEWKQVLTIILSQNLFSGSLPPLNLPSLSTFNLRGNKLSGELSSEICNAKSLNFLDLSDNNFTGGIEKTFGSCLNLQNLVLYENGLSGELPTYLGDLPLITLELSNNKFSGRVPDHLMESQTIMEISLCNNMLEGPIPGSIAKVSTLQMLHLENNLFEGSIPVGIGKLKNLTNLSLHGNNLSGGIPIEIFECEKLVSLDLGSNRLTGQIPKSISNLKLLDNLVLSNNLISGSIPEEICSAFQKVPLPDSEFFQHYGMLNLSNNELEGPIPASIDKCIILSELHLQGNKLNGSIPFGISALENLTLLDLSYNSLTGSSISHLAMKSLQGLILSHNHIRGTIPENFGSAMPGLAKLDLSYNFFSGPLPHSVFNITSLTFLDISKNYFSGTLSVDPRSVSSSLLFLNVSNNKFSGTLNDSIPNLTSLSILDVHNNTLTGTLPSSLSTLASLTYLDLSNNNFTDYFPCNICEIEGLAFVNFSSNEFTGYVPENCQNAKLCMLNQIDGSPSWPCSASTILSRASVLGIALGATAVFVVLLIGIITWRRLGQQAVILNRGKDKLVETTEPVFSGELLLKKPKEPLSINIATFEHSLLRINPSDILSATGNFSKNYIIGDGGFGTVYKASLPGRVFAVKRLNGGHSHGGREFLAEMETIGKVKHENLVPLLGYCVFADERFLIYEYMENGSLDFWLRNQADALSSLDWPTRFKICLGSARGLAFLHHGFVPHIIHRDIKSSNILLDKNFEPKVSDFGLARIISACETHVSTILAGTLGYIPPEYGQTMMATIKGDVYSFGVVILELLTGKAPTGQTDIEGGNLVGWIRWMVAKGRESEVLDPNLSHSCAPWKDQMRDVLSIAWKCTSDEPWTRPSMLEVVKLLKEAMAKC